MADDTTEPTDGLGDTTPEPVVRDNRKIDPETGEVRGSSPAPAEPEPAAQNAAAGGSLTDDDLNLLASAENDLLAELRNDLLRAQADLVNFRTRVERDRAANREQVIAEVIRTLLPAMDDMTRAEKHGDLEGSPLALVAQKLRGGFEKYGLREVGVSGENFDPNFHEAVVQLPSTEVTVMTVAEVFEPGYALGDRLIRAAKVAVHVPE